MRVATEQIDEVPAVTPEDRSPRLGGTDVFRGSLVILTALVIGGFILSRGLDVDSDGDQGDVAADAATSTTATTGGDDTQPAGQITAATPTIPETTVTAAAEPADGVADGGATTAAPAETVPEGPVLRAPAEVKVLVLNGAQAQGIAGRGTEVVKAASYLTGTPKNAISQRPSAVLYVEGYEAEAAAVAAVFAPGLETLVQPLDPADLPIEDTQAAHVIVVIGADQLIPVS